MKTEESSTTTESTAREEFGLFPCTVLKRIVLELASAGYKDSQGQALVDALAFLELERLAYEPQVPDPVTASVAGNIHYLETVGYTDKGGQGLSDSAIVGVLKLMNIRKLFGPKAQDGLKLLDILDAASYSMVTQTGTKRLGEDEAFLDLRRIITLEGQSAKESLS